MDLKFKLIFNLDDNGEPVYQETTNYLLKDYQVHIRLRDYDFSKPFVVTGFIEKLTFITSMLFYEFISSNECAQNLNTIYGWRTAIKLFEETPEYLQLVKDVSQCINDIKFQGISILPIYHRKNNYKHNKDLLRESYENLMDRMQKQSIRETSDFRSMFENYIGTDTVDFLMYADTELRLEENKVIGLGRLRIKKEEESLWD